MTEIKYSCKRDFKSLPEDKLNEKLGKVDDGTTDNPLVFVTPEPTNLKFHGNITNYHTLLHELNDLEIALEVKKTQVSTQKALLIDNLDKRADYVDLIAKGSKETTQLSGNEVISNEKHKRPIPAMATGVSVKAGTEPGTIFIECDYNELADIYLIEESATPLVSTSYALIEAVTASKAIIRDRISGKLMGYRITLKNTSGRAQHSAFVTISIP